MSNDKYMELVKAMDASTKLSPDQSRRFISHAIEQSRLLPMCSIRRLDPWHTRWFGLSEVDAVILIGFSIWTLMLVVGMVALGVR